MAKYRKRPLVIEAVQWTGDGVDVEVVNLTQEANDAETTD